MLDGAENTAIDTRWVVKVKESCVGDGMVSLSTVAPAVALMRRRLGRFYRIF